MSEVEVVPEPKRRKAATKSAAEKAAFIQTGYGLDKGEWAKEFAEAGIPDLENPGTDLDYVRRLQLLCLRQMACTAFPSPAQQKTWQRIQTMSAVVGMTSNRAQLESKVKRLTKLLEQQHEVGTIRKVPGSSIKKPDTARGAPKGPQPVMDEVVPDGQ